ncbi:MAG: GNAT family N-acetyltransferase [Alphaproteobacteria bacterium]|nr:GNAT family N-acetyltransferase [Alphaproteobacteria bacterium]
MPVTVFFRRAGVQDLSRIVALYLEDALGRTRESLNALSWDGYTKAFEAIDQDPQQLLVVGMVEDTLVATCQLTLIPCLTHQGGLRLQIGGVHVKKDYQGKTIGRQMMAWALEYGQEKGALFAQLTTHKSPTDAKRFYETLGFEATHVGMKRFFSKTVRTS